MSVLSCVSISKVFQDNGYEALRKISLEIGKGEAVGIVGESGSGKSTLGNIIGGLEKPTDGTVFYHDNDISQLRGEDFQSFRRSVQYIFQDPKGAMNPYFTLRRVLLEPLRINFPKDGRKELEMRIAEMVKMVNLPLSILDSHPWEVSGGEAQRIAIARAILLKPEVIIADECVSALDLSIQAEVMNLLRRIRKETCTSFLFISHDLSLVRYFCDRVYVMRYGRIVECLNCSRMEEEAQSEYTKILLEDAYGEYQSNSNR